MPDDSTSVFDDTPQPESATTPEGDQPAKKGPGPFKLGVLVMLAGHLMAWMVVTANMFWSSGSIHGLKDIFGPTLLSLGLVFAFVQWLYGVPLVLVGLGIGIARQQWYFLLGVLLVLAVSFALAIPTCGLAVFAGSM